MHALILLNYVFQLMIRYIPYLNCLNCRLHESASHVDSLLLTLDRIYIKTLCQGRDPSSIAKKA